MTLWSLSYPVPEQGSTTYNLSESGTTDDEFCIRTAPTDTVRKMGYVRSPLIPAAIS